MLCWTRRRSAFALLGKGQDSCSATIDYVLSAFGPIEGLIYWLVRLPCITSSLAYQDEKYGFGMIPSAEEPDERAEFSSALYMDLIEYASNDFGHNHYNSALSIIQLEAIRDTPPTSSP
jgi:hypothetical protein